MLFYHVIYGQNTLKHPFLTTRAITISLYLNQEQCHWWLELHCLMALAIWSLGSGSDRVLKSQQKWYMTGINEFPMLRSFHLVSTAFLFMVHTGKKDEETSFGVSKSCCIHHGISTEASAPHNFQW